MPDELMSQHHRQAHAAPPFQSARKKVGELRSSRQACACLSSLPPHHHQPPSTVPLRKSAPGSLVSLPKPPRVQIYPVVALPLPPPPTPRPRAEERHGAGAMRVPCCSLCHVRYDEDERVPLLLHCGHGFCRACLARMLAAAPGAVLPCPRCRHPTAVGNSVSALRKNFPILSLLSASPSSPSFLHSESGSSSDGSDDEDDFFARPSRRSAPPVPLVGPPGCSSVDLASHPELKLARRIGSGPPGPAGQEVWAGTLSRGGGAKRCKHQVAVKRVPVPGDGLEGVQEEVERLRRASSWCRNVCTFHGTVRLGGHLCFVMDRYVGSVQAEMRQNGGRLTLEQILRLIFLINN